MLLHFYVQGSAAKPYLTTFEGEGKGLQAFCSCPAGRRGGLFCKHVAALLKGDCSKLIAEQSDDIALLAGRAEGSPLMAKAKNHTPSKQSLQPLENVATISDISGLIQPLLEGTGLWSEYAAEQNGAEHLTVYLRKYYKNGKPYKNPTRLVAVSYQPFMYQIVYDENTGDLQNTPAVPRTLPYLVDSTNYGKIGAAGANFMNKLKEILKALAEKG